MENVYSSERRNAAPKVVIFRTAAFSLLLVGALATVSEVVSYVYIGISQLDHFLCFIWPGLVGFGCGAFAAVYVHYPEITGRWCLAKSIVALAAITIFSTLAGIVYRILLIQKFRLQTKTVFSDRMKLVTLHFSFSLVLELALFALSVLIANVTITMYKLRTIIDGAEGTNRVATPESMSIQDARYLNLNDEDL